MINSLGSQLSLSKHCLESAFMCYKLAVNRRLTQGRKTIHVVGACLYLVCRTEKTSRILSLNFQFKNWPLGVVYIQWFLFNDMQRTKTENFYCSVY